MLAEYKAAGSHLRMAQRRAAAESGIHYAAALLSSPDSFTNTLNSNPYDNAQVFPGSAVPGGNNRYPCRFSVIALADPDDPTPTAVLLRGLTDETARSTSRPDDAGRQRRPGSARAITLKRQG